MKKSDKYKVPSSEGEILPNLLGLTDKEAIDKAEAEGFANAELSLVQTLTQDTVFDVKYILSLHRLALKHLYSFAGTLRTVNMSKGGFVFPASKFLEQTMEEFNRDILLRLPHRHSNKEELVKDIATVHAELLFIHPFREGNGRTARLLANLMAYKAGFDRLKFEKIESSEKIQQYITAVQKAGEKNYGLMNEIISLVFEV